MPSSNLRQSGSECVFPLVTLTALPKRWGSETHSIFDGTAQEELANALPSPWKSILKVSLNLDSVLSSKINQDLKPNFLPACEAEQERLKQKHKPVQRRRCWFPKAKADRRSCENCSLPYRQWWRRLPWKVSFELSQLQSMRTPHKHRQEAEGEEVAMSAQTNETHVGLNKFYEVSVELRSRKNANLKQDNPLSSISYNFRPVLSGMKWNRFPQYSFYKWLHIYLR